MEVARLQGQGLHLVEREGLVHGDCPRGGLEEGVQSRGTAHGAVGQDPAHDGAHPGLLALDTVEVPVGQRGALAGVGQGLLPVEYLSPCAKLLTGECLRRLEIDSHSTDLVGQRDEGLEVRHREVVDVDAGEVLHGVDRQRGPPVGVGGVDLALAMTGDLHP